MMASALIPAEVSEIADTTKLTWSDCGAAGAVQLA